MIDYIKKIQKKAGHDLEAGEQILDARVISPAGHALRGAVGGAVFANLGTGAKMIADRRARNIDSAQRAAIEARGGMAADFPTGKCYFTLTDRRILVHSFGAMSGAPKDLLAAYPLTDFAGIDAKQGKLISKMTLVMADGTSVPLEVYKGGGDPANLVGAFNQAIERIAASLG